MILETLRKHPVAPVLNRSVTKDYNVPNSDITLKKGTIVMIPLYSIHRDENIFPEPDFFDPERFTEEAKNNRHHYTHFPFGLGPRYCIGDRFALYQIKLALGNFLLKYRVRTCKETIEPITFNTKLPILTSTHKMLLKAEKVL